MKHAAEGGGEVEQALALECGERAPIDVLFPEEYPEEALLGACSQHTNDSPRNPWVQSMQKSIKNAQPSGEQSINV